MKVLSNAFPWSRSFPHIVLLGSCGVAAVDFACLAQHYSGDITSNPEEFHPDSPTEDNDDDDQPENWVEWIERATHTAENQMAKLKLESWIEKARRIKWRARRLLSEQSKDKWSARALQWNPELVFDGWRCQARRRPARPRTRWTDDFTKFAQKVLDAPTCWTTLVHSSRFWTELEHSFVENSYCAEDAVLVS